MGKNLQHYFDLGGFTRINRSETETEAETETAEDEAVNGLR